MTGKAEDTSEREMLLKALISQGCEVEEAQRIVREAMKPRGLMPWGTARNPFSYRH